MGFAIGDLARTSEDFDQVRAMIQKLEPDATMALIGQPGNQTYIARDEETGKVVALLHVEHAMEVRHLLIDPGYQYKDASFTLLHRCMEMNMRVSGVPQYFFTASKNNDRAIKIFKRDGAEIIDTDVVRFRKKL